MNRKFTTYPVIDFAATKLKMLNWTKQFNIFCLLDNHQYNFSEAAFECLFATGSVISFKPAADKPFEALQSFLENQKNWIFGHLSYDLKNSIEDLSSENSDEINFPDLFFFIPETILILTKNTLQIGVLNNEAGDIYQQITSSPQKIENNTAKKLTLKSRFSKEEYLSAVHQIQQHIHRGDCYELNFCQEFFAEECVIDPLNIYQKLSELSPSPFAAFYKLENKFLMCSSPERYLKRSENKIYSQPIKGTSKRYLQNDEKDKMSKHELISSKKETSENVMVVDLVRNDLSKICIEGSVKAEELFGIYSFPQVHQMISTISGTLKENITFTDIIKATFPMGSMTGAPKKRVMELIEKYERTKRGLFSGAIGYIKPDGDFDFNVVIRSIFYDQTKKYISIQAGSAITAYSDAEKEYEECVIKIEAMKKALE